MQFRLRTLLIVLAILPPVIGWLLSPKVDNTYELVEGLVCRLVIFYVAGIVAMVLWGWHRSASPNRG